MYHDHKNFCIEISKEEQDEKFDTQKIDCENVLIHFLVIIDKCVTNKRKESNYTSSMKIPLLKIIKNVTIA